MKVDKQMFTGNHHKIILKQRVGSPLVPPTFHHGQLGLCMSATRTNAILKIWHN